MMRLVADLGGTNCRLALVSAAGQSLKSVQSYRNEDFASFSVLLERYLSSFGTPGIAEMVVALAGPVNGAAASQTAEITNRGWHLAARDLSRDMGGIPVHFMNDLSALGHSLMDLTHNDLAEVYPVRAVDPLAQKLVIGIGTGFNVSPVISTPEDVTCLKSEYGHVALPLDLHQALVAQIGSKAENFTTVECCFSGRGFTALHAVFVPHAPTRSAAEIMAAPLQAEGIGFVTFYAQLLALLSRNLLKGFLPLGGLYFAGSVARSLLTGPGRSAFVAAYCQADPRFPEFTAPVFCILEDAAALKGCAGFRFPAA